jgi:hypothetical protein
MTAQHTLSKEAFAAIRAGLEVETTDRLHILISGAAKVRRDPKMAKLGVALLASHYGRHVSLENVNAACQFIGYVAPMILAKRTVS